MQAWHLLPRIKTKPSRVANVAASKGAPGPQGTAAGDGRRGRPQEVQPLRAGSTPQGWAAGEGLQVSLGGSTCPGVQHVRPSAEWGLSL